jgi:hypothetical protein
MSETSIIAILASVGILVAGTASADAAALADAVQRGTPDKLVEFAKSFPDSRLAPDALYLAAELSMGRPDDSATSSVNSALSCSLTITRGADGKSTVRWATTGAAGIGLYPYGSGGGLGASGELDVSAGDFARVDMVVADEAGNKIRCWVSLGGSSPNIKSLSDPALGEVAARIIVSI